MSISASQFFAALPPAVPAAEIAREWQHAARDIARIAPKILVLDDDPTGTQTVAGVPVWTAWDVAALTQALQHPARLAFILTNSRALSPDASRDLHLELARNLKRAQEGAQAPTPLMISRGDSTLRGHYPLETATLHEVFFEGHLDGEILIPFFAAGGRVTANNIHWVREGDQFVPTGETEFARDPQFGYRASDLPQWIEEKSGGAIAASAVMSISLEALRARDVEGISEQLMGVRDFGKIVVNAAQESDLQVFVVALARAMAAGKCFGFRSAASWVPVLAGVSAAPVLTPETLRDATRQECGPGLMVAGSWVAKTTRQLEHLRAHAPELAWVEVDVARLQNPAQSVAEIRRAQQEIAQNWQQERPVGTFSSRNYRAESQDASAQVAAALVEIVSGALRDAARPPAWIVAKGGITSSDIATRALGARRAHVLGPVAQGVPLWQLGDESAFAGGIYVVFPGNVGGDETLTQVYRALEAAGKERGAG